MDTTSTSPSFAEITDEAQTLNRWIFDKIRPYIKGRTLEISSGINSLCPFFIAHNRPIHLSDTDPNCFEILRATYSGNQIIRSVHSFNFAASDFKEAHPNTLNAFDTVMALNSSAADFGKMVDNINYVLPQGGTLVLILPAYTSIYHGLDQNLDLWKRYNAKAIRDIVRFNFSISKIRYLNLAPDTTKTFFANSGLSVLAIFQKN